MAIALYVVAALALLVLGAYGEHLLNRSKNPKVQKADARLDALFDGATAEAETIAEQIHTEAPRLADQVKKNVEAALTAIAAAEQKAQADVEAAIAKHEAVKTANAQALATIQQAAASLPQA